MRRTNLHRAVLHDAMALRVQPALGVLESSDIFAVRVPGEQWPVIVSFTSPIDRSHQTGAELEVLAFRGARALEQAMTRVSTRRKSKIDDDLEAISCTFSHDADVPAPAKHFLRRAAVNVRTSSIVPVPLTKSPGQPWRALLDSETRTLFLVIRAILLALEQGWLTAETTRRSEGLLTLTLSGDPFDPDLSVGWGEGSGGARTVTVDVPPVMLIDNGRLETLPRVSQTWLIGCPVAPFTLDGLDELVRVFLVVDRRSRRLIDGHTVSGRRWPYAAAARLIEVIMGQGGTDRDPVLPQQILLVDRVLARLVCPELKLLGLTCRHEPAAEGPVATAFDSFVQQLTDGDDSAGG